MGLTLASSAFNNGESIPIKYSCDGDNISPQLKWNGAADKTKTFALIVEDPDAPGGLFVHWVIYNIPSNIYELPEDVSKNKNFPEGASEGTNHFGQEDYGGPCPPKGAHRYYFKLYALDTKINLKTGAGRKDLLKQMEGHILDEAELMGKYERQN